MLFFRSAKKLASIRYPRERDLVRLAQPPLVSTGIGRVALTRIAVGCQRDGTE
jgi:hypothetical protein